MGLVLVTKVLNYLVTNLKMELFMKDFHTLAIENKRMTTQHPRGLVKMDMELIWNEQIQDIEGQRRRPTHNLSSADAYPKRNTRKV